MGTLFFGSAAVAALLALFSLALVPVGMSLAQDLAIACVIGLVCLGFLPGKTARLFFVTLCAWVVVRYFGWRVQSFPTDGSLIETSAAVMLMLAEMYGMAMLLLGLFVNAWPLEREPAPLPENVDDWPTVDVYIPTYSEPVDVVAPTLMAAIEIDYPKHKFNVYILDDGWPRAQNPKTDPAMAHDLRRRTEALQALCVRHGATWLTREKNVHAKSGNMNSAMEHTNGELILVLDADHVPTRDILKNTVGFLAADKKMAFVQTPHFFLNADPIERNLGLHNRMPGENDMFYRVIQKGLDLWNTSFFCGSAALLRRRAVEDVGGFSTESITEDASTSVKMHQKGWKSAYLGIPMVAGLQPETFAGFTVQRLRWAMGMMQILIKQNPLLVRGLALPQRLAYLSVSLVWLFPFARVVFFISPFLSLFFNFTVYPVGMEFFYAYTVPYLAAIIFSFEKTFGKVRRIMISELYETMQAFYTLPALFATLLKPNAPTFKVTPKGERLDEEFVSELNQPFYVFYGLTVVGLIWGFTRMVLEPDARPALALSVSWLVFNFILLSGALGVLLEKVQLRGRPRIDLNEKVTVLGDFGHCEVVIKDMNERTALIKTLTGERLPPFSILLDNVVIPTRELEARRQFIAKDEQVVRFEFPTALHERKAVVLGYGKSSRWMALWESREQNVNFLLSAAGVVRIALRGGWGHLSRLFGASH